MTTVRPTDAAGVLGAALAALCCVGSPFIVSALTATGLIFLRNDAILLPIMFASLAAACWGFWQGWRMHGVAAPIALAAVGAVAMSSGVMFVHGIPARVLIYGGIAALVAATAWNVTLRGRCERPLAPA